VSARASRAARPAVLQGPLRIERLRGRRSAVGLQIVLSRPARVRFLVIGPAPSCHVAGRFAVAAHKGLNTVAFRGRVGGRLLPPGVYTIVPQPAVDARRFRKAVAVAIDARGVRPNAPVRWRNCDSVAGIAPSILTVGNALRALAPRASGTAAAEVIAPSLPQRPAGIPPAAGFGWLQSLPASPQLPTLLVVLIVVSFALLGIASIEPGNTLRFRSVRVVARHKAEIGWLGAALLASVIVFYFLG
jgi:hypothetical protein